MRKYPNAAIPLDPTPHEHEEVIMDMLGQVHGLDVGVIKHARLAGMSWPDILALVVQFGPQFAAVLSAVLSALQTPPPEPPSPPASSKKE